MPKNQPPPWSDDKLKRKDAANFLTSYMTKRFGQQAYVSCTESFVLNLNCGWGFGKTYFLTNWQRDLVSAGYPVIYFDAWKNDFSDEPLLAFIAQLDESLARIFQRQPKAKAQATNLIAAGKKLLKPALPVLFSALLKKGLGLTREEWNDLLSSGDTEGPGQMNAEGKRADDEGALPETLSKVIELAAEGALKHHFTMRRSMEEFQSNLGKVVENIRKSARYELPIFVLVDELDRCRPLYAIELLETIKHLFGVPGVCFVVATDTRQLASSVKAVYGSEFEAELYLKRFFEQEYILPDPDYYSFAQFLFSKLPSAGGPKIFLPVDESVNDQLELTPLFFSALAKACQLDLRGQEQVFNSFQAICTVLPEHTYLHLPLILFLLMLRQTSPAEFDDYWRQPREGAKIGKFSFTDEQIFSGYRRNNREGASQARFSLGEIINTYAHLLTLPDQRSLAKALENNTNSYADSIIRNILNTSLSPRQPNVLKSYFDLVRQAGQLH